MLLHAEMEESVEDKVYRKKNLQSSFLNYMNNVARRTDAVQKGKGWLKQIRI